jgi:hypothetical protein
MKMVPEQTGDYPVSARNAKQHALFFAQAAPLTTHGKCCFTTLRNQ